MELSQSTSPKSAQDYIDETPVWADGTRLSWSPLTAMQWRIWLLAAAGKFFEGLIVFMTGVAIPLIGADFQLTATHHGVVGAATLSGILAGALVLGGLADVFGRRPLFIVEMIIFMGFLVLASLSPSYEVLVFALFGLGVALGCDYPTAHLMISESVPSGARGRLVLSAFGFQAVGALVGTVLGYVILTLHAEIDAWRFMYASAIAPALLVVIGRFFVTEIAPWLVARGRMQDAHKEASRLLARTPAYPKVISLATTEPPTAKREKHVGFVSLLKPKHRRATILAAVPWFLQDLATYGIGVFTPTLLALSFGHAPVLGHWKASLIESDILAAKGAATIDVLLIVGILAAVVLADKVGRIKLQTFGFIGCAAGLTLAGLSTQLTGSAQTVLMFAGFMLFNFMTNAGPNAQTYLLAGEVFPTKFRAKGAGAAAAFAKLGAVIAVFFFPITIAYFGTAPVLYALAGAAIAGAAITYRFGIETTGVNLEKVDH